MRSRRIGFGTSTDVDVAASVRSGGVALPFVDGLLVCFFDFVIVVVVLPVFRESTALLREEQRLPHRSGIHFGSQMGLASRKIVVTWTRITVFLYSMKMRRLLRDDVEAFRDLRLEGLRNHPEAFGESARDFAALSLVKIAERLHDDGDPDAGFVLGAYDGDRLVGVTCLWRQTGLKVRHKAILWGMYVNGEYQGKGIGKQLVAELVKRARTISGLDLVLLSCATVNERARKLYEGCGFTVYGIEPKSLRIDGADYEQQHMMLDLTAS
jgi:RimJ/RimL family protein N-acetyltransferase